MENITTARLADDLGCSAAFLRSQLSQMPQLDGRRPGRGRPWVLTPDLVEEIKSLMPPIPEIHRVHKLSDREIEDLAAEFADGGPVQLPTGAHVLDTLNRLRSWGITGAHVAEVTPGDGVILHA